MYGDIKQQTIENNEENGFTSRRETKQKVDKKYEPYYVREKLK